MKKLLIVLLVLAKFLFVPAFLLVVSYFVRQNEQKQMDDSLRLMQTAPITPSAGGDALLLLNYDVADAATRRQWIVQYDNYVLLGADQAAFARLPAAVRAAKLPKLPDDGLACPPRGSVSGCLETVRSQLPAYQEKVQQAAKLLANADALAQYDNLDYQMGYRDSFPYMLPVVAQRTAAALDWVENRQQAALARVCRNIHTGRVLLRSRGNLLNTMIGNATVARNMALVAEMLAEAPDWSTRLPENCAAVFAPFAAGEPNLCAAMQGEFRYFDSMLRDLMVGADVAQMDEKSALLARMLRMPVLNQAAFSYEHTRRLQAKNLAQFCTDEAKSAVQQDVRLTFAAPSAKQSGSFAMRPACWGNIVGCVATDVVPSYAMYHDRLLDMLMQQRAFQAALALYALPQGERRAALPQILRQHSSPERQLSYDDETKQIVFERYDQRENAVAKGVAVRLD